MSDAAALDDNLSDPHSSDGEAPQVGLPASFDQPSRQAGAAATLRLLPYYPRREEDSIYTADYASLNSLGLEESVQSPPAARKQRDWRRLRAAASLAAVVAIGAVAAAAQVHATRVASAEQAQARALTHRLDAMSTRLESVETARSHDELASLRKVLTEIKTSAASARDIAGAVGQLGARVDKLEKEQSARLDKLGDRIDHDAAARLADVTARLDKLEAKATAQTVAVAPARPSPPVKPANLAKADTSVADQATGSLDRAHPRLRGYWLSEIHNGYAMIGGPGGEFAVAPGDMMPGGGRVLRIERHGRDWVVVTTHGEIASSDD